MKKRNYRKNFLFLRNSKSFIYQKKELILSHYHIIFDLYQKFYFIRSFSKELQKLIFLLSNKNNIVL